MVEVGYTNIQSKIKINGPLSDPFTSMRGVWQGCLFSMLLYLIIAEVLASFINVKKRIKGTQIGDNTIFLRVITCLNRTQVILKLCQDASSSKINFSNNKALWTGAYKNRIDQSRQIKRSQFPLKYLELTLVTLFLITPNRAK